jgi:phosphate transport system protein
MTREHLDSLINDLKDDIIVLESMVRRATLDAVDAMMTNNTDLSAQVYANDRLINKKRFEIENECLIIIATQQPMARDLRILASVLEIVTELERIGDYAKGIAKITRHIGAQPVLPAAQDLPEMARIAAGMMQRAVKAFAEGDAETARDIPNSDDKVDQLFNQVYRGLVEHMINNADYLRTRRIRRRITGLGKHAQKSTFPLHRQFLPFANRRSDCQPQTGRSVESC